MTQGIRQNIARMEIHEYQRRQLVRTLFVVTCLLPTLGIAGYGLFIRTALYRTGFTEALERSTGTVVQLQSVSHPRPHVTRLNELKVISVETGNLLLAADQLDVIRTNLGLEVSGDCTLSTDLKTAWRLINDRLLACPWDERIKRITFRFGRFKWENRITSQSFLGVKCEFRTRHATVGTGPPPPAVASDSEWAPFEQRGSGSSLHIEYAGSGREWNSDGRTAELMLWRHDSAGRPRTAVSLETRGHAVRPALLRPSWYPVIGESELDLTLRAVYESDSWRGEATRVAWRGLEGRRLVNERFSPLRLTGEYEVRNGSISFRNSYVQSITGEIICGNGRISRGILQRLVERGFACNDPAEAIPNFDRLDGRFDISDRGVRITGRCTEARNGSAGALIVADRFRLFAPSQPISNSDFVASLVTPENADSVAAATFLRRVLPIDQLITASRPPVPR